MFRWFVIAAVGTALVAPLSVAQVQAGTMAGPSRTFRTTLRFGPGFRGPFRERFRNRPFGDGLFLFADPYFYSDYDRWYASEPARSEAAPPQVVVMQPPAPAPVSAQTGSQLVMFEWRGDHWARVAGYSEEPSRLQSPLPPVMPAHAAQPAPELPPTLLVFRDGRKEEVSRYRIMNGAIFTSANYWTTGSWSKKIPLDDLDIPATLKSNRERGVNFALPAGPSEIIIRP
jgi:hypothetical protein